MKHPTHLIRLVCLPRRFSPVRLIDPIRRRPLAPDGKPSSKWSQSSRAASARRRWAMMALAASLLTLFGSACPHVRAGGPLAGHTLLIDPGHGGADPGAIGPTGLCESDVNLRVGLSLRDLLVGYAGATVYLTRDRDTTVSLEQRPVIANQLGVDRFISIHHNASTNQQANGVETYAYTNASATSLDLRDQVHRELVAWSGLPNRGPNQANFLVLRETTMPAILTEASFISNPYQESRLRDADYNRREALAIYKGVLAHYRVQDAQATRDPALTWSFLLE